MSVEPSSILKAHKKFPTFSAALVAAIVTVGGITYNFYSSASTLPATFEAEDGTLAGAAALISNSTASGSSAVKFGPSLGADVPWSDTNQPWALKTGESVDDNRPAGVQVIDYANYSNNGARTFGQTLAAIRSTATAPYYVRMAPGTYHVTDFTFVAGSGSGRGYQDINSPKYFGGIIGAGADKTYVVVDPNIMTATQLSGIAAGTPSPSDVNVIYAGGSALTIPTFFSGITFRGNFQQSTTLAGLSGMAPAPYTGLSLVSVKPGSMVQYCRFQGFGFTAKASPPYELGAITSLHSTWTLRRSEIDGRLAKEVNATQPVSSGGLMWNYEVDVKAIDSWLHNTRRSGWAMHDHAPTEGGNANDAGIYYANNFQVERIADTPDSFAGTSLDFNTSNVEELRQSFTYVRPRFTVTNGDHITLGTSNGNSVANSISVIDPIIGNTSYNGCLIIHAIKQPNSLGLSPYYQLYQSGGLAALPFTVTNKGVKLQPVLKANFNASVHTPDKYYLVDIN